MAPAASNLAFVLGIGSMTAFLFVAGLYRPGITREDGVAEWATALNFLATTAVAGFLAAKPGILQNRRDRTAMAGIAAFALLLALSELSFGARLLGLEMPAMRGGGQFDGGHDVVIWTIREITALPPSIRLALTALAGLSIAGAAAWGWRKRAWLGGCAWSFLAHPVRFRFAVAILLLAGGVILDLLPYHRIGILEEMLELAASVALMMTVTKAINSPESFTARRQYLRPIYRGEAPF